MLAVFLFPGDDSRTALQKIPVEIGGGIFFIPLSTICITVELGNQLCLMLEVNGGFQ
jgi:hypothetical protein